MSGENTQKTGAENASFAESKPAPQEPTPEFNNSIKDMLSQPSIAGMSNHAQNLVPQSVAEFVTAVERLRKLGDKSRLALIFLFIAVEERGDYLLWGYGSLKDLVVKGCDLGSSWFYRHYNAGHVALIVKDDYDELPIVCLELLAKVPENTANRKEVILNVLDAASKIEGGITEGNVINAMKSIVPEVTKPSESKRVATMKSIIRSKDAIVKELGEIDPDDDVLKAKVAALEAATKDLLIVIK